jgi:hypothetical protein
MYISFITSTTGGSLSLLPTIILRKHPRLPILFTRVLESQPANRQGWLPLFPATAPPSADRPFWGLLLSSLVIYFRRRIFLAKYSDLAYQKID